MSEDTLSAALSLLKELSSTELIEQDNCPWCDGDFMRYKDDITGKGIFRHYAGCLISRAASLLDSLDDSNAPDIIVEYRYCTCGGCSACRRDFRRTGTHGT